MKMSTKGRYGVRFLMDLAAHSGNGNVTLREIAQRQAISEKYLWQVVSPLKRVGLIRAASGPGGGYGLGRPAAAITLLDILTALEGDCALVACTREPESCPRSPACAAREVWKDVDRKLSEVLAAVTLEDMVEKQRALAATSATEYCI